MIKIITSTVGIIGAIMMMYGIVGKAKKAASISIIGGADGPTSIFLAGKVGNEFSIGLIVIGIALIVVAVLTFLKMKK